ncbi:protein rep [Mycolicibacterium duvalii]|uniref:protein rep n=1 Tax=Mycolicibacterium duvalii TaxID=39688 RepID=UPI0010558B38|nr:protein rep [Mycolicibacterium duvalii]MCV7366650.1 protein rep [Mycolicibacterium duvalii]
MLDRFKSCHFCWICPVCGVREAEKQADKLAGRLEGWVRRGGRAGFLTLTQRHSYYDDLLQLWNWLEFASGRALRASSVRDAGVCALFRSAEIVHHPDSGWNVHTHSILFLGHAMSASELAQLKSVIADRFVQAIHRQGGSADRQGQDLRMVEVNTERTIAAYCLKGTTIYRSDDGSRTPMQVLADIESTDTEDDHRRWSEVSSFALHRPGKRFKYTPGIDRLCLP